MESCSAHDHGIFVFVYHVGRERYQLEDGSELPVDNAAKLHEIVNHRADLCRPFRVFGSGSTNFSQTMFEWSGWCGWYAAVSCAVTFEICLLSVLVKPVILQTIFHCFPFCFPCLSRWRCEGVIKIWVGFAVKSVLNLKLNTNGRLSLVNKQPCCHAFDIIVFRSEYIHISVWKSFIMLYQSNRMKVRLRSVQNTFSNHFNVIESPNFNFHANDSAESGLVHFHFWSFAV